MNTFQPWQDTIPLLAGARPPRRAPLGERFETPEPSHVVRWNRYDIKTLALRVLFVLSFTAIDIRVGSERSFWRSIFRLRR